MPTVPPPPSLPISTSSRHFTRIANSNEVLLKECLWALEDLEVQKACFFSKICTLSSPKECVYLKVNPTLQVGPTCGLVAIAMIMQGRPTAGDCMKQARELNYTNNGEMFSAKWLLDILNRNISSSLVCCLHPEKLRSYLYSGDLNTEFIKEKLKLHCFVLVAYDADRNHSPCLKNGHSAHWALLVGYLIDENNEFYVFVRHGKTKSMALFSLDKLSESNSNLNEFVHPKWHKDLQFILPDGGINGIDGLKNKAILVEGVENKVIKVV
ncbi:unnamed protein product [Diamesa serratosioi]